MVREVARTIMGEKGLGGCKHRDARTSIWDGHLQLLTSLWMLYLELVTRSAPIRHGDFDGGATASGRWHGACARVYR